jgi:methylated-DNA-[protein]-cysteine S-methyltransferase
MQNITYTWSIDTPIGKMRASSQEGEICGLWFEGQKYFPNADGWAEERVKIFEDLQEWLDGYFEGKQDACALPLLLRGTPFEVKVWKILHKIPYAKTLTYGEIAKSLASEASMQKMSAQAVGSAVGKNKISILVPCHRVLGYNGSLVGYAGGLDKKRFLLSLEKNSASQNQNIFDCR